MSFRGRLRLFFVLLVIVPMIALAVVLFTLTARSETGKVDTGISAGTRTAFGIYEEAAGRAEPALREVASDRRLRAALASGDGIDARLEELVSGNVVLAGRVKELTGLETAFYRDQRLLAATADGFANRDALGGLGDPHDVELTNGADYRARVESIPEPAGPPVELALLQSTSSLSDTVSENRVVIGGLLVAFLLLAMLAAARVSRALTGQIGTFLDAARRLARGDFAHPVPATGRDEFAQLGHEFNSMSSQLEAKIEEIEHKREELEATIRRVGDALATGLDRDGVVALAVRQAVDACAAEAGRALPVARGAFHERRSGRDDARLDAALVAAERRAFEPRPELGPDLLDSIEPDTPRPRPRRASTAQAGHAHALAVPLRAVVMSSESEFLGVLSIARRGSRLLARGGGAARVPGGAGDRVDRKRQPP